MRFTFAISATALAALAVAAPQHSKRGPGMAIPITKRNAWLTKADGSINFAALDSHIASAEARVRRGFANFERNTGSVHPAAENVPQRRAEAGEPLSDVNSELWYGTISIGTPPQDFTVAFSTASRKVSVIDDLVVPSSKCDSTCNGHTLWDTTSSSTAQDLGQTFNIGYGDGSSTSGEQYTDTVSIAGLSATSQTIGAATTYSTGLQSHFFVPDGIMGLGYQSISVFNAPPVMQNLDAEGVINPVFSFKLSSSGGELYIGGTNDALYTGEFTYEAINNQSFWGLIMIIENGDQVIGDNTYCVIDTSTTVVIGVAQDVENLYNSLGGTAAPSYGPGYYTFPCNSFPTIDFWFGGTGFPISPSTLNLGPVSSDSSDCLSGIVASQDSSATSWIVGDVFLMNVYTTFDFGNTQVGFATLA